MNKEKTLREHLTEIATKAQAKLKKKLGKKGYSERMKEIRKGKKK